MRICFEAVNVEFEDFIDVAGVGFDSDKNVSATICIIDNSIVWVTETGAKLYKVSQHDRSNTALYVIEDPSERGDHGHCIPDLGVRNILQVDGEYGKYNARDCADPLGHYAKERNDAIARAEAIYDSAVFVKYLSPANRNNKEVIVEDLAFLIHGGRLVGTRLA